MNQLVTKIGPFLQRIFKTNWLTTLGGIICLAGVYMLAKHLVDKETAMEVMGSGTAVIGLGAKDGVREHPTVAPESLDAPDVAGPGAGITAALLLLLSLAGLSACGSSLSLTQALQAPRAPLSGLVQQPQYEATPDSLVAPAWYQGPAYLAPPPAGLTRRQLRQFRRAQRKALVEAARTVPAKIKVQRNSAYAAADGTAVAQYKPAAPVGIGTGSVATDNSHLGQAANGGVVGSAGPNWSGSAGGATAPKPLTLEQRLVQGWNRFWPWLAVVTCAWLAFVPIGAGGLLLPVVGALFRRRNTA